MRFGTLAVPETFAVQCFADYLKPAISPFYMMA